MKWLSSEGGPLVIVASDDVLQWTGCDGEDYDQACEVEDYAGIIDKQSSQILVLGDEPMATALFHTKGGLSESGLILVRWQWAKSESDVAEYLANIDFDIGQWPLLEPELEFKCTGTGLLMFDAVDNGLAASGFEIELPKGRYLISTYQYEPDDQTCLILHCFNPERSLSGRVA